jgi:hypothetical protein
MRVFLRVWLILAISILIPRAALSQAPERGWPRVCRNPELLKAMEVIDRACTGLACDLSQLRQLDTTVDKASLLAALRDPNLMPVHIFFPIARGDVSSSFDWEGAKRDQLAALKYNIDPTNTVIYIVAHSSATGSTEQNIVLSRKRMMSVMQYLRDVLRVPCRSFRGVWLGEETFSLTASDAKLLGIASQDYRDDPLVLNQAVHVFIYPCAELER